MTAQHFDWSGLMHAGLNGMGLQPAQFWALTPAEFLVMAGQGGGFAPLGRDRLAELAAAFPDTEKGRSDE